MSLVLYSYYRSSAAYRVRIALNLKRIEYRTCTINLRSDSSEQSQADFLSLNPQGLVPALKIGETIITQSSAIIEYVEEVYPQPRLLPENSGDRAYIRSLAQIIACDIHPLNNLRVLNYLESYGQDEDAKWVWYRHWIQEGFKAYEELLRRNHSNGFFCFGDTPCLADVFLIPQVYNAKRFQCELKQFPLITGIYDNCRCLMPFSQAAPENQLDAEIAQATVHQAGSAV